MIDPFPVANDEQLTALSESVGEVSQQTRKTKGVPHVTGLNSAEQGPRC
jgi:hypothetical protein